VTCAIAVAAGRGWPARLRSCRSRSRPPVRPSRRGRWRGDIVDHSQRPGRPGEADADGIERQHGRRAIRVFHCSRRSLGGPACRLIDSKLPWMRALRQSAGATHTTEGSRACPTGSPRSAASTATFIPRCQASGRCCRICPITGATRSVQRRIGELDSIAYPNNSPLTCRPDWRLATGKAGSDPRPAAERRARSVRNAAGDLQLSLRRATAVQRRHGRGFRKRGERLDAHGVLDGEKRLRASIVVPMQNPTMAGRGDRSLCRRQAVRAGADAADGRDAAGQAALLGRSTGGAASWPAGGHPSGSSYRHPVTAVGWPSYYTEDLRAQAQAFQTQLTSLICEGVFSNSPIYAWCCWNPASPGCPRICGRLTKYWRGCASRYPGSIGHRTEIVRKQCRFEPATGGRPGRCRTDAAVGWTTWNPRSLLLSRRLSALAVSTARAR